MSLLQVIGKGSAVKVLEGQSHKQPDLCGEIGRVVEMPGTFGIGKWKANLCKSAWCSAEQSLP
jgi:hypothetical protein